MVCVNDVYCSCNGCVIHKLKKKIIKNCVCGGTVKNTDFRSLMLQFLQANDSTVYDGIEKVEKKRKEILKLIYKKRHTRLSSGIKMMMTMMMGKG